MYVYVQAKLVEQLIDFASHIQTKTHIKHLIFSRSTDYKLMPFIQVYLFELSNQPNDNRQL